MFELTHFDVDVKLINHYTPGTLHKHTAYNLLCSTGDKEKDQYDVTVWGKSECNKKFFVLTKTTTVEVILKTHP